MVEYFQKQVFESKFNYDSTSRVERNLKKIFNLMIKSFKRESVSEIKWKIYLFSCTQFSKT